MFKTDPAIAMLIKKVPVVLTMVVIPMLNVLGTKAHESQLVTAGSIIVRQRGWVPDSIPGIQCWYGVRITPFTLLSKAVLNLNVKAATNVKSVFIR